MNKNDLVRRVHAELGGKLPQLTINEVITRAFDNIMNTVIDGDEVMILGFGTFTSTNIAEQVRGNLNGIDVTIPAHRRPRFRPGRNFRQALK